MTRDEYETAQRGVSRQLDAKEIGNREAWLKSKELFNRFWQIFEEGDNADRAHR